MVISLIIIWKDEKPRNARDLNWRAFVNIYATRAGLCSCRIDVWEGDASQKRARCAELSQKT